MRRCQFHLGWILLSAYLVVGFDPLANDPLSCDVQDMRKVDAMALFQVRAATQAGVVQSKVEGELHTTLHMEKYAEKANEARLDFEQHVKHEGHETEQAVLNGKQRLAQQPLTTTTSEGFFQRLQDSLTAFVLGVVLIVFSIPALWFNESRAAQMESLTAYAKSAVRTVDDKEPRDENRNWLVHIEGAGMHGAARVADKQFDVSFESGCIKLSSFVEVYQVIQHEKKEEREKLGGGKETITTYTYTEEWSSMWQDSQGFQDPKQRGRNSKPTGLDLGPRTETCARVEYGGGFLLSDALTNQCGSFEPVAQEFGEKVRLKTAGVDFNKSEQSKYYYYGKHESSPQLGDARVSFDYIPDGTATVMALQADNPGDSRATFLPYRVITRPWFYSLSEADEKKALLIQAKKSAAQLADEAGCTGCLGCLCCACNLVMRCFSAILTPEICHLFNGSMDQYACFKEIVARNTATKWCFRLAGWLMMFIGLYMLFSPFLTLIKVIPFLGPLLAKLGGGLIWFLCLLTTLLIATVIVMLAYLFYHPLVAFLYGLAVAAIVVGTTVLLNFLN